MGGGPPPRSWNVFGATAGTGSLSSGKGRHPPACLGVAEASNGVRLAPSRGGGGYRGNARRTCDGLFTAAPCEGMDPSSRLLSGTEASTSSPCEDSICSPHPPPSTAQHGALEAKAAKPTLTAPPCDALSARVCPLDARAAVSSSKSVLAALRESPPLFLNDALFCIQAGGPRCISKTWRSGAGAERARASVIHVCALKRPKKLPSPSHLAPPLQSKCSERRSSW